MLKRKFFVHLHHTLQLSRYHSMNKKSQRVYHSQVSNQFLYEECRCFQSHVLWLAHHQTDKLSECFFEQVKEDHSANHEIEMLQISCATILFSKYRIYF